MIAGIPSRAYSKIKPPRANVPPQLKQLAPRPGIKAVFVPEHSPWCDERQDLDFRPEQWLQVLCEGLGNEGHVVFAGGCAQELSGNDQIANFPKFDGQKSWFGGRWCHCGQTNVLDIKPSRSSRSRKGIHLVF